MRAQTRTQRGILDDFDQLMTAQAVANKRILGWFYTDRLMAAQAVQKERINCANDLGLDISRWPGIDIVPYIVKRKTNKWSLCRRSTGRQVDDERSNREEKAGITLTLRNSASPLHAHCRKNRTLKMSPCFAQYKIIPNFWYQLKTSGRSTWASSLIYIGFEPVLIFETIKRPYHRARKVVIRAADGLRDIWCSIYHSATPSLRHCDPGRHACTGHTSPKVKLEHKNERRCIAVECIENGSAMTKSITDNAPLGYQGANKWIY